MRKFSKLLFFNGLACTMLLYSQDVTNITWYRRIQMKKVLSTIVAALVAVSFAGLVSAAEVKTDTKSETTTTSPSGEVKVEKKEVKKTVKKHRKHHKKAKKAATDTAAPATPATPASPAEAPAAK
jgi:hypothetical protein